MDSQLDRLFSSLDSSFSAAVSRSEDEAADDLALSLRQDQLLVHLLARTSVSVRDRAQRALVVEVGRDFVRTAGECFYPLSTTVLESNQKGPLPASTDRHLVEILRAAARSGSRARVEALGGVVTGLVVRCGPDHVSIRERGTEVLIPLEAIRALRLSRAD